MTMPDPKIEQPLLPCPFCGGKAMVGETLDNAWYAMCEQDCRVTIERHWGTRADALAAWNARATPAQQQDTCTCLTELEDDAYGAGGPMSGKPKPPACKVHAQQQESPPCAICGRGEGFNLHAPFGDDWHEYEPVQQQDATAMAFAIGQAAHEKNGVPDALREAVRLHQQQGGSEGEGAATSAVYHALYGSGYDPFQHPEGWEFAEVLAKAALAAHPAQPVEPAAGEEIRLAYKTGYNEGYSDASDGLVDHDAAEEGWGQYLENLTHSPAPSATIERLEGEV